MFKRILGSIFLVLLLSQIATAQSSLSTTTCPGAGCVKLDLSGAGSAGVQITGTFVGTLQFEHTIDGTNYVTLLMTPNGGGTAVTGDDFMYMCVGR